MGKKIPPVFSRLHIQLSWKLYLYLIFPVNIQRICNHNSTWDLLSISQLTCSPLSLTSSVMPLNSHGHQGPVLYECVRETERQRQSRPVCETDRGTERQSDKETERERVWECVRLSVELSLCVGDYIVSILVCVCVRICLLSREVFDFDLTFFISLSVGELYFSLIIICS